MKDKPGKVPVSSKASTAGSKSKQVVKTIDTTMDQEAVKAVNKAASAKSASTKTAVKSVAKPLEIAPEKATVKTLASKPEQKKVAQPAVKTVPAQPALRVAAPAPKVRTSQAASRLAQLTVPSMSQAQVTAAVKATYIPSMSQTLIAPPAPSSLKKDPKLANNWKTTPAEQLTDAELLAMPDSEYMNDKQLAAFRSRLMGLKQDILNNAGATTEHLREDTVIVPDPADRATIEEEHALELRTRDRERKLLKKIEQSIARIDAGDYGYCDETGEPIGVGRLLARPTATLSLEAQQRRELKQKMFGD